MKKEKFDLNDIKLINALCKNPKIKNKELSDEVGLKPPETLSRLKRLTDNSYFERFKPIINYVAFGYMKSQIYIVSCELVDVDDLSQRISSSRLVITAYLMRPRSDKKAIWIYLNILGRTRSAIDKEVSDLLDGLNVFLPEPFIVTSKIKENEFFLVPGDVDE